MSASHNHSLFDGLNAQQLKAVQAVNGRVLILAGAGSGKTRVLTVRMAHLIRNLTVSPGAILGLTFTNKAAAEMRHRIAQLVDPAAAKRVTLCTFHSFCMQILRAEIHLLGYTPHFTLYDEYDVGRLVQVIARDLLERDTEMPSLAPTMAALSHARNRGMKAEEIQNTGSAWHDQFSQTIFQRLQDSMRAHNAVDFDGLLALTVQLFERYPEALDRYQERFRYIMIDEYQDTNPIQYRLALLLAGKYQNLCVVGDDDQSIYGWRGADVHHILHFEHDMIVKLEQNYRSTNAILRAANAVIGHNQKRHRKSLWSNKEQGGKIEVFVAPTEIDEAQAVVFRLDRMRQQKNLQWRDMAILYRSNALARSFEHALMRYTWKDGDRWRQGIPYQVFGGTEFYERREIRDLFSYLRVLVNPLDEEALLRIINQPRRGIGETALDAITAYNRQQKIPLWTVLEKIMQGGDGLPSVSTKAQQGLLQFWQQMQEAKQQFQTLPLGDAMLRLVENINYKKAIHEEVKSEQMREFKWQNVQEFVTSIREFENQFRIQEEKPPLLADFVATMPLHTKDWGSNGSKKSENSVSLMTFHSAKGLEFPACYLVGCEDHIIPHEKSLLDTGLEEERRLMYVAMTRAMEHLTISMASKRLRLGKECHSAPSRFLLEIPPELLQNASWKI